MLPVYLVMALFAAASCRPQAPAAAAAAAAVTPAGVVRANRRIANVIKLLNKVDHSSLASRLTELHPVLANFSKRNVAASALFRQITSNLIARQQAAGFRSIYKKKKKSRGKNLHNLYISTLLPKYNRLVTWLMLKAI